MSVMRRLREKPWFTDRIGQAVEREFASVWPPMIRASLGYHVKKLAPGHDADIDAAIDAERQAYSIPTLENALNDIYAGRAILWVGAGFSLPPPPSTGGLLGGDIKAELIEQLSPFTRSYP
ncbi:hypothetical protein RAS1_30100 [Phycisphaerae bacterium RAS1]|nr:hypothetical protein RAS1_30100 [Phycisphaerae bacterium RAS1]